MKDRDTAAHCVRVGRASGLLARAAGLDDYAQRVVEFSGVFHDVGKVGVPDHILFKPARLTESEFEIMKSHPEMSVQALEPMLPQSAFLRDLVPGVRHHHERYDGAGYPIGVAGEDIPLEARLILICDTFDAMTSTRAYRKGLSFETAYAELKKYAGTQFDPRLVKIFLQAHPLWGAEDAAAEKQFAGEVLRAA